MSLKTIRAGLFSLLVPFVLTACSQKTASSQKWEYLVVSDGGIEFSFNTEPGAKTKKYKEDLFLFREAIPAQKFLDVLGKDGWELVDIVGQIGGDQEFVFKRPLK